MTANLAAGSDQAVALGRQGHTVLECKLILAATILASSLAFLDGAVVNIALPRIGVDLSASGTSLQWLVTGYLLPLSALQLLAGALGDYCGRRRALTFGIALFTVASGLCAMANNINLLLFGRIVQGVGAAFLLPNSLAVLGTAYDGRGRGKAVATWTAAGAIASALGPPLAGWMIDAASWRLVFLLNIPLGLAALGVTLYKVPESSNDSLPLDFPGTTVATLGLLCLTWSVTQWSVHGGSVESLGSGAAALVFLVILVGIEKHRGTRAMIPLQMFGSARFVGLNLYTFLLFAAFGALFVLLPFVLMKADGYTAMAAGSAILPLPLVLGLASAHAARFANEYGSRISLGVGAAISAAGYGLLVNVGNGSYWIHVFPGVFFIALGMTIIVAPLTTAILSSVGPGYTATAAGFNSAISRTGSLIAIAALGSVLIIGEPPRMLAAFHGAAAAGLLLCAASSAIAFLALRRSD